jgi:hypothetical protein
MTAVALPDIDLARLRSALEGVDLARLDPRQLDLRALRAAVERAEPSGVDLHRLRDSLGRLDRPDLEALGLARLRSALDELDLPRVDLPRVDLPRVDLPRVDLPRVDLPRVDLPRVDLPDLERIGRDLGSRLRRDQDMRVDVPSAPIVVGLAALVGGLLIGVGLAWLLHPRYGRRRRARVLAGLRGVRRRVLGSRPPARPVL